MPDGRWILSVAEMVAAEQQLISAGVSVDKLMQRAGNGAAQWVWRAGGGGPVTMLCGPGNNGGDGYVIAENIRQRGGDVEVIAPLEPRIEAASKARQLYQGCVSTQYNGQHDHERRDGVFVDCLFGSGLRRPLDGAMLALMQQLASSHPYCVAVDLPSGIDADTAQPLNPDLPHYDLTLALGAWKFAHWLMPAAAIMGQRHLVPIGVAGHPGNAELGGFCYTGRPYIAAPAVDAHKYTRGLVRVIGGQMPGAAILASLAAMAGGAGYVRLLASGIDRDAQTAAIPALTPDLVMDEEPLADALSDGRTRCLLIGPGLGRDAQARQKLEHALAQDCDLVLDADALTLLSPAMLAARKRPIIITPHEGELKALSVAFGLMESGAAIKTGADKLRHARSLARKWPMVVVVKGPDTLVALPDGRVIIMPPASSWLSVAGSGDVLAGLIASRFAVTRHAEDAVRQALWLHGEAARLAGPAFRASDLVRHIAPAVASS